MSSDSMEIFSAVYSGVSVYEFQCEDVAVMRRQSDDWYNATQILKVAGLDKPQRTRVLERDVQKGVHEKVQGGYGRYQGTWVPPERAEQLVDHYGIRDKLQPVLSYVAGEDGPPPSAAKVKASRKKAAPPPIPNGNASVTTRQSSGTRSQGGPSFPGGFRGTGLLSGLTNLTRGRKVKPTAKAAAAEDDAVPGANGNGTRYGDAQERPPRVSPASVPEPHASTSSESESESGVGSSSSSDSESDSQPSSKSRRLERNATPRMGYAYPQYYGGYSSSSSHQQHPLDTELNLFTTDSDKHHRTYSGSSSFFGNTYGFPEYSGAPAEHGSPYAMPPQPGRNPASPGVLVDPMNANFGSQYGLRPNYEAPGPPPAAMSPSHIFVNGHSSRRGSLDLKAAAPSAASAAASRKPEVAKRLYVPGAPMGLSPPDKYAQLLLDYFVSETDGVPKFLVERPDDFDPNVVIDDDGHTALHWAAAMGKPRVVRLLVDAGADIFAANAVGQTPLLRSVLFTNGFDLRGFPDIFELLMRSAISIDNSDKTIFHYIVNLALIKKNPVAAMYYLQTALDKMRAYPHELARLLNFPDTEGETVITLAARGHAPSFVRLLWQWGSDPTLRNNAGQSAESYIMQDQSLKASLDGVSGGGSVQPASADVVAVLQNLSPFAADLVKKYTADFSQKLIAFVSHLDKSLQSQDLAAQYRQDAQAQASADIEAASKKQGSAALAPELFASLQQQLLPYVPRVLRMWLDIQDLREQRYAGDADARRDPLLDSFLGRTDPVPSTPIPGDIDPAALLGDRLAEWLARAAHAPALLDTLNDASIPADAKDATLLAKMQALLTSVLDPAAARALLEHRDVIAAADPASISDIQDVLAKIVD